jgi:hypothetical protein
VNEVIMESVVQNSDEAGDRWAPRPAGPLAAADIQCFMDRGWCAVRGAFDATRAAAARAAVWRRMRDKAGIREDDPATWPAAYDIEERLDSPEVLACFPDVLCSAIEQLVGRGRWFGERRWGFWPVNFHYGRDAPEPVPLCGWHVDGNWFRHVVDCPKQGLLVMGLFSDVPAGSGGTVVAQGSHIRAAQVMADHPQGLTHRELFEQVLAQPIGHFAELTGQAGDVVLCHPFLFHTRGFKRHGGPRFQSNVEAPLCQPLELDGNPARRSILELSVHAALAAPPMRFEGGAPCSF